MTIRESDPDTATHKAKVVGMRTLGTWRAFVIQNPVWAGFLVSMLVSSIALFIVLGNQRDLHNSQTRIVSVQRALVKNQADLADLTARIQAQRKTSSHEICVQLNHLRAAIRAVSQRFDIQPPLAGFGQRNCNVAAAKAVGRKSPRR